MIGDEPYEPYDRPPLSKQVLTGWVASADTTLPRRRDIDADWRLGVAATGAGPGAQAGAPRRRAGGRVRPAARSPPGCGPGPGRRSRGRAGRRVRAAHPRRRRRAARAADGQARSRVLVIGAGFTGSESPRSAASSGMPGDRRRAGPAPLVGALGGVIGRSRRTSCASTASTCVRPQVTALEGEDGRLRRAHLSDGTTSTSTWRWWRWAGSATSSGWRAPAGGRRVGGGLRRGLPRLRRQRPGHRRRLRRRRRGPLPAPDVRLPVPRDGALGQRRHPGRGRRPQHDQRRDRPLAAPGMPAFWSPQFGNNIKSVGVPTIADEVVITQGSVESRQFVAAYGYQGRVIAAVSLEPGEVAGVLPAADRAGRAVPAAVRHRPARRTACRCRRSSPSGVPRPGRHRRGHRPRPQRAARHPGPPVPSGR